MHTVLCCIQVPTDDVLADEATALLTGMGEDVEIRMQKIAGEPGFVITADSLGRARPLIADAVRKMIRPDELRHIETHPHPEVQFVVGVACTSLSFVLTPAVVDAEVHSVSARLLVTDMARAQLAAVRALGMRHVALFTPYTDDLSRQNANMLGAAAQVVSRATLGLRHDRETSALSSLQVAALVAGMDTDGADGIVVGCSAFRACQPGFIDSLEHATARPVVTSTQAFLWHMLRLGRVPTASVSGYGQLFRTE